MLVWNLLLPRAAKLKISRAGHGAIGEKFDNYSCSLEASSVQSKSFLTLRDGLGLIDVTFTYWQRYLPFLEFMMQQPKSTKGVFFYTYLILIGQDTFTYYIIYSHLFFAVPPARAWSWLINNQLLSASISVKFAVTRRIFLSHLFAYFIVHWRQQKSASKIGQQARVSLLQSVYYLK